MSRDDLVRISRACYAAGENAECVDERLNMNRLGRSIMSVWADARADDD